MIKGEKTTVSNLGVKFGVSLTSESILPELRLNRQAAGAYIGGQNATLFLYEKFSKNVCKGGTTFLLKSSGW